MAEAIFGGGCFWCLDAIFRELRGVVAVTSGYCGGKTVNPDYEQICSGQSGHAEVVRIVFDPAEIGFRDLLEVFFAIHDPSTRDRQGNDIGSQYRSVVFCQDAEQEAVLRQLIGEQDGAGNWPAPIVTEVAGASPFYPAEHYHQNYYRQNPGQGYCAAVIGPKLAKFRRKFAARL